MKLFLKLLLFVLCGVGAALSILSIDLHLKVRYFPEALPSFCHVSEKLNCAPVLASKYAELFGVPLGVFGAIFYLAFAIVLVSKGWIFKEKAGGSESILFNLSGLAFIGSILLFAISQGLIGATCPICMGIYFVNIGLYLLSALLEWRSFPKRIAAGIVDFGAWIKAALGKGSSLEVWGVRSLLLLFIIISSGAFYLPKSLTSDIVNARETQTELERRLVEYSKQVVAKWAAEPVAELPLTPSGPMMDYSRGPVDAPIQVVEFADFECPSCRKFYEVMESVLKDYGDKVHFVFRNFPIDNSCNQLLDHKAHLLSCRAAIFARCAGEQGRFWDALDRLFTLPALDDEVTPAKFEEAIQELRKSMNLDGVGMSECESSARPTQKISDDITLADRLGLEMTPTLWVNGKKLQGATEPALREIFDSILAPKQVK